jgi:hypothetical protein
MDRRFTRRMARLGGSEGNARLTGTTGVLLIALLAVEGVTILFISPLISVHVFVGLLLVPPVALKLATTGWRFLSYYARKPEYVAKGPPPTILRVLVAPVVVVSTVFVFGTGIAMLVVHPRGGPLLFLHKASFVVWLGATGVHVLAHLLSLPRLATADWRAVTRLPAARLRLALVALSVVVGVVFAAGLAHLADPWLSWVAARR